MSGNIESARNIAVFLALYDALITKTVNNKHRKDQYNVLSKTLFGEPDVRRVLG